jgi:hypothetical protein
MHAIVRADSLDDVTTFLLAPLAPDGRVLNSFRHLFSLKYLLEPATEHTQLT